MELNKFDTKLLNDYLYLKIENVKLACENDALKEQLAKLQNTDKKTSKK